jgi:uncharacterized membrane protein YhhN
MIKTIFKNPTIFSVIFFLLLFIDIYIKENLSAIPYRYISKPLVILFLLAYYLLNKDPKNKTKFILTIVGLLCFLVGDVLLINGNEFAYLATGISFFILGKAFYCYIFSHSKDFNISRLIPFFIVSFIYTTVLFILIYDNLGSMFVPVLIFLFVAIMMLQLAYLRKNAVSKISYQLVLIGALISMVSDTVTALKEFYTAIPFQEITIMLFYGISQYFIILGITKEGEPALEENTLVLKNEND